MTAIRLIEALAAVMGAVMSLGYYPQAYKIFKTKSARDVSAATYVIFGLGTLTWFVYGIAIKDLTIIAGFVLGVVGSWLVLGLALYYRNRQP